MSNDIDIKIKAKTEGTGEVKKLETQLSALGKIEAFKKLKKDLEASRAAWKAAQAEVAKLAKEMSASEKPTKDLSNRFKAAQKEAASLKTEFLQNQQSLHKLRVTLSETGIDTKNLNAEQKKLALSVAKSREELSKAAKINAARGMLNVKPFKDIQSEIKATEAAYIRLKKSGKLSMAELYKAKLNMKARVAELKEETNGWAKSITRAQVGLAALASLGYATVKSFSGFSGYSQRMAEVNTMLEISDERLNSLKKEVIGLTTLIPQTRMELAAAEYDIISAGVALESSTKTLLLSGKAAVAGLTDTKTAANVGLGVLNAYDKEIEELGNVYDILFQTVKSGVTTFPLLAQHIGEVLPTARSADVQFYEVASAIAAMTKAGIRTPQAATAMKGAINAMAAPAPEAKKKFDELGITWKGLIPTLEAIREKGLAVDQMRLLIPDVEARTGVLALTQNMDTLKQILDGMTNSAGSMNKAFDKMKDTPENQIKLFVNEIGALSNKFGAFLSTALLPTLKGIRQFINAVEETDPVTKALIVTMSTAGAGFVLWKVGLGTIALGLQGMTVQAIASSKSLMAVAASSTLAGNALKAGIAAGAVYGVYQIGKFIKVAYETKAAVEDARKAQESLLQSAEQVMRKYEEFKDIKLPDDITGEAPEELETLRRELQRARAYWVALQQALISKAGETTLLGNATKEALEAQKELKTVNQRLAEVDSDLKRVAEAGKAAGESMKEPAKAVEATKEQLDEFEKQAKKAYEYATDQAKKYAEEVIAWEEKIKYARMSTEDKIRELSRKGLSEEKQWIDERLQAEEKLAAAKEALRNEDYELAEKLAKDAESLYAGLAEEIMETEKSGDEIVKQSLEDSKKVAINGVQTVGDFMQELYGVQKQNAGDSKAEWEATAKTINQKLDEIAKERTANISIKLSNLESAQNAINDLTRNETKYITVVTRTVEEKQNGGPIVMAAGGAFIRRAGRLSGYGGGDRIRALLEQGEYIIRKEAVAKYGTAFFNALNAMRIDMPGLVKAKMGGLISGISLPAMPVPGFAAGGIATSGASETLIVRFQAGDLEAPVKITDPKSREAMKLMAREMSRMRLTNAR